MKKAKIAYAKNKFWMTLKIIANKQIRVDESLVRTMQGFKLIKV